MSWVNTENLGRSFLFSSLLSCHGINTPKTWGFCSGGFITWYLLNLSLSGMKYKGEKQMFSLNNFQRGSAALWVCDGVWSLCKSCAHGLVVSMCLVLSCTYLLFGCSSKSIFKWVGIRLFIETSCAALSLQKPFNIVSVCHFQRRLKHSIQPLCCICSFKSCFIDCEC